MDKEEIDPALDPTLDQLSRRALLGRAGAAATAVMAATGCSAQDTKMKHALDDEHINKTDITFDSKSGDTTAQIKGFLATPKGDHKRGSVVVIHEIFGLTDHIRDIACRLAQAGYNALSVNFFTREGEPPNMKDGFQPLMAFVGKIPDRQILDDAKAAMTYLRGLPTSNGKVGSVGFCWGGRFSMLLDADAPDLNAAVAYYGRISGEKTETQPQYPIDVVEQMKAPLLGHFGALDTGIPPAEANKLRDALKAHHKTAQIYEYERAGHAFNNDTRESYNADAAKLAWKRTLDWYKHNLH